MMEGLLRSHEEPNLDPLNPPEIPGMEVSTCDLSTREEETNKGS